MDKKTFLKKFRTLVDLKERSEQLKDPRYHVLDEDVFRPGYYWDLMSFDDNDIRTFSFIPGLSDFYFNDMRIDTMSNDELKHFAELAENYGMYNKDDKYSDYTNEINGKLNEWNDVKLNDIYDKFLKYNSGPTYPNSCTKNDIYNTLLHLQQFVKDISKHEPGFDDKNYVDDDKRLLFNTQAYRNDEEHIYNDDIYLDYQEAFYEKLTVEEVDKVERMLEGYERLKLMDIKDEIRHGYKDGELYVSFYKNNEDCDKVSSLKDFVKDFPEYENDIDRFMLQLDNRNLTPYHLMINIDTGSLSAVFVDDNIEFHDFERQFIMDQDNGTFYSQTIEKEAIDSDSFIIGDSTLKMSGIGLSKTIDPGAESNWGFENEHVLIPSGSGNTVAEQNDKEYEEAFEKLRNIKDIQRGWFSDLDEEPEQETDDYDDDFFL